MVCLIPQEKKNKKKNQNKIYFFLSTELVCLLWQYSCHTYKGFTGKQPPNVNSEKYLFR